MSKETRRTKRTNRASGIDAVGIRLVTERRLGGGRTVRNVDDVVRVLSDEIEDAAKEAVYVINLDGPGKVLNISKVSDGGRDQVYVSPRDVFTTAILSNAARVILVHNHVAFEARPSTEDILTTVHLEKAGRILGIHVDDHIIIASRSKKRFSILSHIYQQRAEEEFPVESEDREMYLEEF